MQKTITHATNSETETHLGALLEALGAYVPSETARSLGQSIQDLFAAIKYQDRVLTLSSGHAAVEKIRDLLQEYIDARIGRAEKAMKSLETLREAPLAELRANADESGRKIIGAFDSALKECTDALDSARMLQKSGYEVRNISRLELEIEETRLLRRRISDGWPWSTSSPPLVDRAMVARIRAAVANGDHGESADELIKRLSS